MWTLPMLLAFIRDYFERPTRLPGQRGRGRSAVIVERCIGAREHHQRLRSTAPAVVADAHAAPPRSPPPSPPDALIFRGGQGGGGQPAVPIHPIVRRVSRDEFDLQHFIDTVLDSEAACDATNGPEFDLYPDSEDDAFVTDDHDSGDESQPAQEPTPVEEEECVPSEPTGVHYHIGVQLASPGADRRYCGPGLRSCLDQTVVARDGTPLYGGRSFNVNYTHKDFYTIVKYCVKEDDDPIVGGSDDWTVQQVLDAGASSIVGASRISGEDLARPWDEIVNDANILHMLVRHYTNIKNIYNDRNNPGGRRPPLDVVRDYYQAETKDLNGHVDAYTTREVGLQWAFIINWITGWFNHYQAYDPEHRGLPHNFKKKQLLVLGRPNTGKTSFFLCLEGTGINILWQGSSRADDFSHYRDDRYHLCCFDEFSESNVTGDVFKKFLQGTKVQIDRKCVSMADKRENLPVVMTTNHRPNWGKDNEAFDARIHTTEVNHTFRVHWNPLRLAKTIIRGGTHLDERELAIAQGRGPTSSSFIVT